VDTYPSWKAQQRHLRGHTKRTAGTGTGYLLYGWSGCSTPSCKVTKISSRVSRAKSRRDQSEHQQIHSTTIFSRSIVQSFSRSAQCC
jgi:hypothetical protein